LAQTPDEWIGVDLGSGAFVRAPGGVVGPDESGSRIVAVEFTLAAPSGPPDPSRPELLEPAADPIVIGTPKPRAVRRFLGRLATPETNGATILGTRGPSIAFVDLDGTAASVQLLAIPAKRLELGVSAAQVPVCSIPWGGTTQWTKVADEDAARAALASAPRSLRGPQITAAMGFRPNFVLIGLGRVTEGHVPKLVLALL
jgi:hypothetical protein